MGRGRGVVVSMLELTNGMAVWCGTVGGAVSAAVFIRRALAALFKVAKGGAL